MSEQGEPPPELRVGHHHRYLEAINQEVVRLFAPVSEAVAVHIATRVANAVA